MVQLFVDSWENDGPGLFGRLFEIHGLANLPADLSQMEALKFLEYLTSLADGICFTGGERIPCFL